MLREIFSLQEEHLGHKRKYRSVAFIAPYQGGVLEDDLALTLLRSGKWPELPDRTRRLSAEHHISTHVDEVRYFAIGAHPIVEDPWYYHPETIEATIARFCKGINRLPVNKEELIAVVLNPYKIPKKITPVHAVEFIAQQMRTNCTRPIVWFMR
jgi:hypothetical protein